MAMRILIADDALFMRTTLRNILTQNGFEVVGEARNGAESVRLFEELKPDVVTMDITMPEMDGIRALVAIRESSPDANVVMCSPLGQRSLVEHALDAGARDIILKPFQPDRVLSVIRKLAA